MAIYEAMKRYEKCYECGRMEECPDSEAKIKAALAIPPFPVNTYKPDKPYKSKYYDDHRFDPPRELTVKDVIRAMEASKYDL